MTKSGNERLTQSPTELGLAADRFKEYARRKLKQRFEVNSKIENNLPYHDVDHSLSDVAGRVERIIRELGGSEDEVALGRIAAYGHDLVQNWKAASEEQEDGSVAIKRIRAKDENEKASADETAAWMEENEIGSEDDRELVRQAIMATVAEFNQDIKTSVQPNVTTKSPLVVRALALADIGSFAIEGGKKSLRNSDNLFREENLDLLDIKSKDSITPQEAEAIKNV